MDTENCTNLYLQVSQIFLSYDEKEPSSYNDLFKLIPWLRQSLTCCVCSKLLHEPMSSTESTCQHYVCAKCNGGKMVLKPTCSWCKDYTQFELNKHLEAILLCFSKLCECLYHSPLMKHITVFDKEQQRIKEDMQTAATENSSEVKAVKKGAVSRKRKHGHARRKKFCPISLSVTQALNDGLNVKHANLDWLEKNVKATTDLQTLQTKTYDVAMQKQSNLTVIDT